VTKVEKYVRNISHSDMENAIAIAMGDVYDMEGEALAENGYDESPAEFYDTQMRKFILGYFIEKIDKEKFDVDIDDLKKSLNKRLPNKF